MQRADPLDARATQAIAAAAPPPTRLSTTTIGGAHALGAQVADILLSVSENMALIDGRPRAGFTDAPRGAHDVARLGDAGETVEVALRLSGLDLAHIVELVDRLVEQRVSEQVNALLERGASDDPWTTVAAVAHQLHVSQRTVYRALGSGALAGERIGNRWRIRDSAIAAWLEAPQHRTDRAPRQRPQRTASHRAGAESADTGTRSFRDRALAYLVEATSPADDRRGACVDPSAPLHSQLP